MPSKAALSRQQKGINKAIWNQRTIAEKSVTLATARELSTYFRGMASRLRANLEEHHGPLKEAATAGDFEFRYLDWKREENLLRKVVQRTFVNMAGTAWENVNTVLGLEVAFDLNGRNIQRVMTAIGPLVKGITEESRERLASIVKTGIEAGDAPGTIAGTMLQSVSGWAGLEDLTRSRAMVIARTETAHAYNLSTVAAYRDSGLVDTVICLDSPDCGWDGHNDPELAADTVRTMDEAEEFPTSHPNCVRAFAPNVAGLEAPEQAPADEAQVLEPTTPVPEPEPETSKPTSADLLDVNFWDLNRDRNVVDLIAGKAPQDVIDEALAAARSRVDDAIERLADDTALAKQVFRNIDREIIRDRVRFQDVVKRLSHSPTPRQIENGRAKISQMLARATNLSDVSDRIKARLPIRDVIESRPARRIGNETAEQLALRQRVYDDMLVASEEIEKLTGLRTRWRGMVSIDKDLELQGASGAFNWNNGMSISPSAGTSYTPYQLNHVIIHEAMHGASPQFTAVGFSDAVGWEEGLVEHLTLLLERRIQPLMTNPVLGDHAGEYAAYGNYKRSLSALKRAAGIEDAPGSTAASERFFREMFQVPVQDRRAWLEERLRRGRGDQINLLVQNNLDYLSGQRKP